MALLELCWAFSFGTLLAWLGCVGRGRRWPTWVPYFAPGCAAWICGSQGLLFRRQADFMVGYVVEARTLFAPLPYVLWAAITVALAWLGSATWLSRLRWGWVAALAIVFGLGAGYLGTNALAPRLRIQGSTLEFQAGLGRSLESQPAFRTLLGLSLIASLLPVAGAAVAVIADSIASRPRAL
jgi:hypothetical protein